MTNGMVWHARCVRGVNQSNHSSFENFPSRIQRSLQRMLKQANHGLFVLLFSFLGQVCTGYADVPPVSYTSTDFLGIGCAVQNTYTFTSSTVAALCGQAQAVANSLGCNPSNYTVDSIVGLVCQISSVRLKRE